MVQNGLDRFVNIFRRIITAVAVVGASFLIVIMAVTVANVGSRLFGGVIVGSYELTEILIVVTAGSTLCYTTFRQKHIFVNVLVSRFSQRTGAIVGSFTSAIGLVLWVIITWATVGITHENALLGERTVLLGIPYIPFRSIWIFCLILVCFGLFTELYKSLKVSFRK